MRSIFVFAFVLLFEALSADRAATRQRGLQDGQPTVDPVPTPSSIVIEPTPEPVRAPSPSSAIDPTPQPVEAPTSSTDPTPQPVETPTSAIEPTPQPVETPTSAIEPTPQPVDAPSNVIEPTPSPLPRSPTGKPTKAEVPTRSPTPEPVKAPSSIIEPTPEPTAQPPTEKPTKAAEPTPEPTSQPPTNAPTKATPKPTTQPPTIAPTKATPNPTTPKPTKEPTRSPSKRPTPSPTGKPTARPSKHPVRAPTNQVTKNPTKSPTTRPTTPAPTIRPSKKKPTKQPTPFPSTFPTRSPTLNPSISPSLSPTDHPTKWKSESPTISPTTSKPSFAPTQLPSRGPTEFPTSSPTLDPTASPTTQNWTKFPTRSPTSLTRPPTTGTVNRTGGFCDGEYIEAPAWDGLGISALAFSCVGILIGLCGALFLVVFYNRPIIRMSQGAFLLLFCFAISTLNAGMVIMIFTQHMPEEEQCMASFGIIEMSLVFLITALGMKEWRAWKVRLKSLKLQKVKIGNKVLYFYIGLAALIMTILLVIWFVLEPPYPDPCKTFRCTFGVWFYVSWGYLLLLILATTGMAFIARDCPSVGAEASGILYVSVFILFVIIFETMIITLGMVSAELQIWLLSFGVLWISACYVLLIVFRKYTWVDHTREEIHALFLQENKYASASSHRYERDKPVGGNSIGSSSKQQTISISQDASATKSCLAKAQSMGEENPAEQFAPPRRSVTFSLPPQSFSSTSSNNSTSSHVESITAVYGEPERDESHDTTHQGQEESSVDGTEDIDRRLTEARIAGSFKIASKAGWEEYVDGETGDSFWVQIATRRLVTTPPSMFIIPA